MEAIAGKLAASYKDEAVVSTFKRDENGKSEEDGPSHEKENINLGVETGATPKVGSSEREFAVGVLSEYLSVAWTARLANHLGVRSPEETKLVTPTANFVDHYQPEKPTEEVIKKTPSAILTLALNLTPTLI